MSESSVPDHAKLRSWLERQRTRDPALFKAAEKRLRAERKPQSEGAAVGFGPAVLQPGRVDIPITIETIVREGRPALFVVNDSFTAEDSFIDSMARVVVKRLEDARSQVDPMIPLVGRIDVKNHATGLDFLGTGWLVADDVVITNRHVAELLAERGADRYEFVMGRFGERVSACLAFGHERAGPPGPSVDIDQVLFIEQPGALPDVALLKVKRETDGTAPKFIPLAKEDPNAGQDVVVIGYPARASSDVIPDQDRMEKLYGRTYDVKRAAPGKIDDPSRGWTTHDCTTLGGNSGSVVLDMKTGTACALHFAGLYLIENYAVPASTLRRYLEKRPWPYRVETSGAVSPQSSAGSVRGLATQLVATGDGATVTLPLTITISLGLPGEADPGAEQDAEACATQLAQRLGIAGVLAVRPGVVVENGAMRDETCLVVAADPRRLDEVRARTPANFGGSSVQVRPASVADQLGGMLLTETPRVIAYDDDARTGPNFRLDWIAEDMTLRLHVGPDRGFEELSAFLEPAKTELISSIYQFYADHVRAAVDNLLGSGGVTMTLVADSQTRDRDGPTPSGQFDRSATFDGWRATGRFENIYVPEGSGGLVDNAYHIKVSVRDGRHVWLSSGNWTRTSQPKIAKADRNDAAKVSRAGNREWHVIANSKVLAARFRSHLLQDLARCRTLGGLAEAAFAPDILIDVPETYFEAIELEAAADRVFEPQVIKGKLRVKPLLTPDHQGAVYCDAVIELINSAQRQLCFQNQYVTVKRSTSGRFGALVDALARASQRVSDCRIILRSDGSGFWDNVAELKRRGIDVARQVRRLASTHTKGIIVDGQQVLVGSHNWSQSGVTLNRDASLIIDDPRAADYFLQVFETDWKRATKLTTPTSQPSYEAPRLAAGDSPPPGFRRVPLATLTEG